MPSRVLSLLAGDPLGGGVPEHEDRLDEGRPADLDLSSLSDDAEQITSLQTEPLQNGYSSSVTKTTAVLTKFVGISRN